MAQNGLRMTQNDPEWPKNDPERPKNYAQIYALFPQFLLTEKAVPQTFSLLECMPSRAPPSPHLLLLQPQMHAILSVTIRNCVPGSYYSYLLSKETAKRQDGVSKRISISTMSHVSLVHCCNLLFCIIVVK